MVAVGVVVVVAVAVGVVVAVAVAVAVAVVVGVGVVVAVVKYMSKIFPHVTAQNPCPVCGKPDWCAFGDRAVKCMRVESPKPCASGGWFHFYDETKYTPPPFHPPKSVPKIDAAKLIVNFWMQTKDFQLNVLSQELGVTVESLKSIGASWAEEYQAWAFPMYDGEQNVCGIRLRNRQGFKWAVSGSKQGVFIPNFLPKDKVVYLPEGPTDTVAAISLGFYAIGRPTCQTGNLEIKSILKRLGIHRAVIVADNDGKKKLGAREARPGVEGAMKLKKELGLMSVVWMPPSPIKDLREYLNKGGTKEMIESDIRQMVWDTK